MLGVIALIATPSIKQALDASKQELYEEQITQIEDGIKNWAHANIFLLPEENNTITLSLGQLAQSGHASSKIKNPKNNKCFSNESLLKIIRYNNSFIYKAEELIDIDCDLIKNAPTIKLNGDVVQYLSVGNTYIEKGATAKDADGIDISNNIKITISGNGNSIDTTNTGTYNITYSITNDEKIMTAIRTIIIK